jgi:hypothetical protein
MPPFPNELGGMIANMLDNKGFVAIVTQGKDESGSDPEAVKVVNGKIYTLKEDAYRAQVLESIYEHHILREYWVAEQIFQTKNYRNFSALYQTLLDEMDEDTIEDLYYITQAIRKASKEDLHHWEYLFAESDLFVPEGIDRNVVEITIGMQSGLGTTYSIATMNIDDQGGFILGQYAFPISRSNMFLMHTLLAGILRFTKRQDAKVNEIDDCCMFEPILSSNTRALYSGWHHKNADLRGLYETYRIILRQCTGTKVSVNETIDRLVSTISEAVGAMHGPDADYNDIEARAGVIHNLVLE